MWQHHDNQMRKLNKIYNKISKQTKNRLQEIFKILNLTYENIYNITDKRTKNMIDVKIVEWKDKKLLKGYFGALANNIYNRTRVKNSEILELLIYSAYIEEQNKLDEYENQVIYNDMNYYYTKGQEEVNESLPLYKRKEILTLTDILFLSLLAMNDSYGYDLNTYKQIVIKNNTDKLYRQAIININQQKELDIYDVEFQNIIDRQVDNKIKINGNKIYGVIDHKLIELDNRAKLEGIKLLDKKAKVRFISDNCDNVTPMCKYMDGMIFSINDYNEFTRYVGLSIKDIRQEKIKVWGLVQGANLPPITSFFHWCHSTIQYVNISTLRNKDDIIVPYIRKNVTKDYDTINEEKAINDAINLLPIKLGKTLNDNLQFIIVTKGTSQFDFSRYDSKNKVIYIYQGANKYEVIHEIGHLIEDIVLKGNKEYLKVKQELVNVSKLTIIERDNRLLYALKNDNFIDEYQGYIHCNNINETKDNYGKIKLEYITEIFSESFREYFENPNNLKEKLPKFYKIIKEILE